jgi:hypothetical protein
MPNPVPRAHSFAEFWPYYLGEHRKRATRRVHVIGTLLAFVVLLAVIVFRQPIWLLAVPLVGYGFAWLSHAFIEKNRPATFAHPLWSLRGDLQMLCLWLTGRLEEEAASKLQSNSPGSKAR